MESRQFNYSNQLKNSEPGIIEVKTSIYPWKITRYLLIIVAILTSLSLLGHFSLYLLPDFPMKSLFAKKFALNEEQNFPTLYSSLALFFSSVLFGIITYIKTQTKNYYRFYWMGLSFIFAFLSVDELLTLHEHLSKPMHKLGVNGILHNAWVVPGFVAVAIFSMIFYQFFLHLPRYMKRLFITAILIYLGGAMFVEVLNGSYKFVHGENNLGYALFTTIEEVMEMLGVVVLIHSLLLYIAKLDLHQIKLDLNFVEKPEVATLKSRKLEKI